MSNRPSHLGLVASVTLILLPLLACCQVNPETSTGMPVPAPCVWTASGESTRNRFGYAVGTAGDGMATAMQR